MNRFNLEIHVDRHNSKKKNKCVFVCFDCYISSSMCQYMYLVCTVYCVASSLLRCFGNMNADNTHAKEKIIGFGHDLRVK